LGLEGKDPATHLREGQELELRVIESDAVNRRIVLTVTAIPDFEGGSTPEGVELSVETEVRPTESQIEAQDAAPVSAAVAHVPPAELGDAVGQHAGEVEEVLAESERTTEHGETPAEEEQA